MPFTESKFVAISGERDGWAVHSSTEVHDMGKQHGGAPNHKSQIASDLTSRSPNRKSFPQISGCRKRSAAKGVRSLFFVFGTLSVTFRSLFLMLLSLFSSLFFQTPFAGLLLRQGENRCLAQLKSHFQIARFVMWTSVQIAVRIATPISYATSQNNELFWEGSHCLKSLVICDSRFESQIAIAVKSRDLEHLGKQHGGVPKGRRRGRAEKRLSKRVFWRVRFFSAPLRFSGPFRCFKRKP